MNSFALAFRNLTRNRRRSLTTLLALTVGVTAVLVFGGYRADVVYGLETAFVQHSGHLQIQRKGYFLDGGDNPVAYGISGYEQLIARLKTDPVLAPMLVTVSPQLQLSGLAGNASAGASRSVFALGLVVPEYNRMLQWNDYAMVNPSTALPLPAERPEGVVIGQGVARKLGLCSALQVPGCVQAAQAGAPSGPAPADATDAPADILALSEAERQAAPVADDAARIELLAATSRGAPNVASLHAAQARNMGIKALDDVFMMMHLSQAQRLIYGTAGAQATAIAVQLQHTRDLPVARQRIDELLAAHAGGQALEVLDFAQLNPLYKQTQEFMDSMFSFIAMMIGVIVLFTVSNTMSTAVVERTVEIGTLRAIGLKRAPLRRLFLCEGLLLGLCGSLLGLAAAHAIALLVNHSELTWMPPGYSYNYRILILLAQDPGLSAGCVLALLLVTVASAWFPAHRASRKLIVDALRHV